MNNNNIVLGVILGSGIDLNEDLIENKLIFYVETSGIHKKIIYSCTIGGKNVLVFRGRKHYYEGYSLVELTHSIKIAQEYGVKNLLITNAAGGLNDNFAEGNLMLITSHVNFNDKLRLKKSKPPYSKTLQKKFKDACIQSGIKIHEGVYGYYSGPLYETKAEIRMQRKIGLDAAGMSTVPEAYEAAAAGMEVAAVSVITNLLRENIAVHASHNDVAFIGRNASNKLTKAICKLIFELN